ncbi:single-stranded DNA-binding protein [Aeoliella sp.]|uniref:single-stranded DNA-binding protein n=1 Tax=Aeoliella sp. TaxID=2795800 RepID=UPI003CCBE63B
MASFNRVVLMGHLTRDPELRFTAGKKAVCDVGLAVNDRYRKEDEWVETVDFFDLTFWGRNAEVVNEYLTKGSPILVEGRLRQETWEKDGQKRSRVKVQVDQLKLLGSKPSDEEPDETPAPVGVGEDESIY